MYEKKKERRNYQEKWKEKEIIANGKNIGKKSL
jgi:hypothetical protein